MFLVRFIFDIATAHVCELFSRKNLDVNNAPPVKLKETAEDILEVRQKFTGFPVVTS